MPGWPIPAIEPAAARKGAHFGGVLCLRQLPELSGKLAALPAGELPEEVTWRVRFEELSNAASNATSSSGATALAEVEIEGAAWLVCQRTLEPYLQKLQSRSRVALVATDEAAAALAADLEPRLLAPGEMLDLGALVGEEVLLALPLVPRSPAAEAPPTSSVRKNTVAATATDRPFAALAQLMAAKSRRR